MKRSRPYAARIAAISGPILVDRCLQPRVEPDHRERIPRPNDVRGRLGNRRTALAGKRRQVLVA